jgi:hypothetical protein
MASECRAAEAGTAASAVADSGTNSASPAGIPRGFRWAGSAATSRSRRSRYSSLHRRTCRSNAPELIRSASASWSSIGGCTPVPSTAAITGSTRNLGSTSHASRSDGARVLLAVPA